MKLKFKHVRINSLSEFFEFYEQIEQITAAIQTACNGSNFGKWKDFEEDFADKAKFYSHGCGGILVFANGKVTQQTLTDSDFEAVRRFTILRNVCNLMRKGSVVGEAVLSQIN